MMNKGSIRDIYERKGFRYLGSGSFCCVFLKKNRNRVIKVFMHPREEGSKTHLDYLALCQLFPNEPAFPKVYSFGKDDLGLDVVEVEKLIHYELKENWSKLVLKLDCYCHNWPLNSLEKEYPHIARAMSIIREYLPSSDWDISYSNILQRESTGEFVLSDPIW